MDKSEINCRMKRAFSTRSIARREQRKAIGKYKKKFEVYKCKCGYYHLTKRYAETESELV